MRPLIWASGVTTTPYRRDDLLPRTLRSLAAAGFASPRLFVDGDKDGISWEQQFGLEVTTRYPTIRALGNWELGLRELFIRNPTAQMFAMFQDDLVMAKNVRAYLDQTQQSLPIKRGYLNLITYSLPEPRGGNEEVIDRKPPGWYTGKALRGSTNGFQVGVGAVALVFTLEAAQVILESRHTVKKPLADGMRGWKAIDGGVVNAMNCEGWHEYVHSPSLVQHIGRVSTVGNDDLSRLCRAKTFPGESFDALSLLGRK